MLVLLVVIVALFWLAIFFGFHAASGTSFLDYLRGAYEPLPERLGEWRSIESDASNEVFEERVFFDEARPNVLLVQRRTRDRASGAIVRVEPERLISRTRIRR